MKYWEINGHSLEFDEEDHIYICDGIIVPSVSTILKAFYNDYREQERKERRSTKRLNSTKRQVRKATYKNLKIIFS